MRREGKPARTRFDLVKAEALAYLKLGLLTPLKSQVAEQHVDHPSELGVLFVPGVGANGAQFLTLKEALRPHACGFEAFEYWSFQDPHETAKRLTAQIRTFRAWCSSVLLVGHSLGGVLARLALQSDDAPREVRGFVAICSPLHGTWRSRLAPHPRLRALAPDHPMMTDLATTAYRLEHFEDRLLTIGGRMDPFVKPTEAAFLDGYPTLLLDDVAHAGSLFDPRVARAVVDLAARLTAQPRVFPLRCGPLG
ncbi:MAG: alpha/beta fold hydrolase [Deltaproteobacteria bacterium]|nr:alpha/beta fold hydrolase [Deltaproteobacteria bacterium]